MWGARRWLVAALGALVVMCVGCPSALAVPKGEFAVFSDCPLGDLELSACTYAKIANGQIATGRTAIAITNPVVFRAGFVENEETGVVSIVSAADGDTLSRSPQLLPGGLGGVLETSSLPRSLQEQVSRDIRSGVGGVTATVELAAPASAIGLNVSNLLGESGVGISVAVKVHLANVFLGPSCYIGSQVSPIVLGLTTGATSPPLPSKSISGHFKGISVIGGGQILTVTNALLVDNAFAMPRAVGCGGSLAPLVDAAINARMGLPSPAGRNTVVLGAVLEQAGAEAAREHE